MKFNYSKVRNVISPERGTKESSGIDFFIPKFDKEFKIKFKSLMRNKELEVKEDVKGDYIKVNTNQGILIPLGIKMNIPLGYDLTLTNKSGVASKHGMILGAKLIDSDYEGEVLLNLWNISNKSFKIRPDFKAVQGVIRKVELLEVEELHIDELFKNQNSERGEGGFGSTNKKL